jgi:hypothetical protein
MRDLCHIKSLSELCELSPVSPDFSLDSSGVRSIRTISQSIRVPLCPTATFQCEEYKYPSYPLTYSLSLLLISNQTKS